jgi:hypothetical protein
MIIHYSGDAHKGLWLSFGVGAHDWKHFLHDRGRLLDGVLFSSFTDRV